MGDEPGVVGAPRPVAGEHSAGAATAASADAEQPFVGTFEPRLDDKGRLFLPAHFRPRLAAGLMLTPGQERCIYVFTRAGFNKAFASLRDAPLSDPNARMIQRWVMAKAADDVPDKQGRITVPPVLREWAGLTKDCVVVGAGRRCEIWDAATWARLSSASAEEFATFAIGGDGPSFEY